MSDEKIVPIQFQKSMVNEIEDYINSGLYSSKAEFVREAVRMRIIELRKDLFSHKVKEIRELSKSRGANIKTHFLSKDKKEEIAESFRKKLSA
ncbi:MAG: ribbon-helix-helix domain-containing protein [Candidatus Nanoarchaeia archaeon]|nr:ribbon-helix-helix domain-containing protein [Candidatus Nanoarchaeia archaeon]